MMDIRSKCAGIFSKIMEVEAEQINGRTSPDTIELWDSLSHVQLISALEEEFKIEISPEEGIEIEDFDGIVSFVEKRIQ